MRAIRSPMAQRNSSVKSASRCTSITSLPVPLSYVAIEPRRAENLVANVVSADEFFYQFFPAGSYEMQGNRALLERTEFRCGAKNLLVKMQLANNAHVRLDLEFYDEDPGVSFENDVSGRPAHLEQLVLLAFRPGPEARPEPHGRKLLVCTRPFERHVPLGGKVFLAFRHRAHNNPKEWQTGIEPVFCVSPLGYFAVLPLEDCHFFISPFSVPDSLKLLFRVLTVYPMLSPIQLFLLNSNKDNNGIKR